MRPNEILVNRLAERRQTHQFVLAAIDLEPAIVSERRIEQPDRMRKLQMMGKIDFVSRSCSHDRGAPFTNPIERQNGGFLEWAREKRACGVTFVMICKNEMRLFRVMERFPKNAPGVQFLL